MAKEALQTVRFESLFYLPFLSKHNAINQPRILIFNFTRFPVFYHKINFVQLWSKQKKAGEWVIANLFPNWRLKLLGCYCVRTFLLRLRMFFAIDFSFLLVRLFFSSSSKWKFLARTFTTATESGALYTIANCWLDLSSEKRLGRESPSTPPRTNTPTQSATAARIQRARKQRRDWNLSQLFHRVGKNLEFRDEFS